MLENQRLTDENNRLNMENNELILAEEKLMQANKKMEEAEKIKEKAENEVFKIKSIINEKCYEYEQKKRYYENMCQEIIDDSRIACQKRDKIEDYIAEEGKMRVKIVIDKLEKEYNFQISIMKYVLKVYGIIIATIVGLSIIDKKEFFIDIVKVFLVIIKGIVVVIVKVFNITTALSNVSHNINNVLLSGLLIVIIRYVFFIIAIVLGGIGMLFGIKKLAIVLKKNMSIWDWNIVSIVTLLIMFYGKYIKQLISINLFIFTLILVVIFIWLRKYIADCLRKRRENY